MLCYSSVDFIKVASVPVNDVKSNCMTYVVCKVLTDSFPGSKPNQVIMGVAVAGGVALGVVLTIIILKVVPRCCRRQRGKLVHFSHSYLYRKLALITFTIEQKGTVCVSV